VLGAFFFVQRAAGGVALYAAFLESCGAAAALMVLAGLAQRLHGGDRLRSARLPGGVGAEFESTEAVDAVRATLDDVSASLTARLDEISAAQDELRARLTRLEQNVVDED
jgi:hypothetical protein